MPPDRRDARVDALLRIRLSHGSLEEFIQRYALNVSRGGIFVRTLDPRPPGAEVVLDVSIGTGHQVLSGKGIVRWTTPPSGPGETHREPGMGIKFTELTPETRALIDRIVASRGGDGLGDEPPGPAEVGAAG